MPSGSVSEKGGWSGAPSACKHLLLSHRVDEGQLAVDLGRLSLEHLRAHVFLDLGNPLRQATEDSNGVAVFAER